MKIYSFMLIYLYVLETKRKEYMDSGILKTLILITSSLVALFVAFLMGNIIAKVNKETRNPDILGKLDFTTSLVCEQSNLREQQQRLRDRAFVNQMDCHLVNNLKVEFNISFSCQRENLGVLCKAKIEPEEEKEELD